ncbi:hypothetical protein UFOVP116_308 [uncultured Caudovirales phage]|uniref:Uncharacterized protein n=1 Tax=uncultured Caudovirales phage TaxID=2100421 RepID=A0A6J5LAX2_9CAUD|nr:hypothetical protein UFOVP116_308 [uncultured Caudovirales phage]
MYKKIIHNIIEEHFTSEAALKQLTMQPKSAPRADANLVNQLKTQSKSRWDQICNSMRENIISIISVNDDQTLQHERLMKDVDILLNDLTTLYGKPTVMEATRLIKAMLDNVLLNVKNIRASRDTKESATSLEQSIQELAQYLGTINAVDWAPSAVKSILTAACESWIGQASARFKKDWVGDFELSDRVRKILVSGVSDTEPSFADVVSAGIIRQFPMVFRDAMA